MENYSLKGLSPFSPVDQDALDKVFWEEMRPNYNPTEGLYHAVCRGKDADMQLLISQGANVNVKDLGGNSLVYIAAVRGYIDVLKILIINSANVEATDANGCKPIYAAALHNQLDIVKYLVQVGADLEPYGYILMHTAAINNDIILISLLSHRGVGVNITDDHGCTALHYAAQHEKLDAIKWLVLKGANIDITSRSGYTPIAYAMRNNKFHAIVLLCNLGADVGGDFKFFKSSDINQIFLHGSLAENLSAALNVYNTFFKRDEGFKCNLLGIISKMTEDFQKGWDYAKIKAWLEDESLGSLREIIYQTDNVSKSYSKIKSKLKKSKIVDDRKVQKVLEKVNFDILLNSLEEYQFELVKKSISLDEIKVKLPSLLRINDLDSKKTANFTPEELISLSNLKISELLKIATSLKSDIEELKLSASFRDGDDTEVLELQSVELDELEQSLVACSPFYFGATD